MTDTPDPTIPDPLDGVITDTPVDGKPDPLDRLLDELDDVVTEEVEPDVT